MGKKIALILIVTGFLLAFTRPLRSQEVNSDVNIPPPRELVSGAPAVNGLFVGPDSLFRSPDQVFRGAAGEAAAGILNETDTRRELGQFMTSLMVRAGIVAFARPPARQASAATKREDGSRPAWSGSTPMALSVRRTSGVGSRPPR